MAAKIVSLTTAQLRSSSPLSPRQHECVAWIAEGKTAEDIASIVGIKVSTVRAHIESAKESAGVYKDTALVAKALRNGWIE